jgi:hypothetical protein
MKMMAQKFDYSEVHGSPASAGRATRFPALKAAKIVTDEEFSTINCTIRNLSDSGALLKLAGLFQAPRKFDLLMVSSKQIVHVEKVWQRGVLVGVHFLEDPKDVTSLDAFGLLG